MLLLATVYNFLYQAKERFCKGVEKLTFRKNRKQKAVRDHLLTCPFVVYHFSENNIDVGNTP